MPISDQTFTDKNVDTLAAPNTGYLIYLDPQRPHFGVRVTAGGTKAWVLERRLHGKTVRRTLRDADGARAITLKEAEKQFKIVNGRLEAGEDIVVEEREERKAEQAAVKEAGDTFEVALREYVEKQRRGKEQLPLKARTKFDYLAMISPGGTMLNGAPKQQGALYAIAKTPITHITADDMRSIHAETLKRSTRRATYAMQVLRAVLNWHGVKVPGNPLGKEVAGKDRIKLASTSGKPNPIPAEHLGAWWRAACNAGDENVGGSKLAGDYYRFRLLTGCRGVEVLGDDYGDNEPIRVRDVDLVGKRIVLRNTKNRKDLTLLLSKQALEIVKRNMKDKKPGDALFAVGDPRKTLQAINVAAGVDPLEYQGHDLRDTFASIGDELVSSTTLKRMLNHTDAGDVTSAHYIGKSEVQLRAGWQVIADFIKSSTAKKARKTSKKSQ
jgi:integrase